MDLSIIIVTYNSRAPVERCIASIETHEPRRAYEIVVVDNASSDGTAEAVAKRFPRVRVVANDENLGYSRGVNQGIRLSSGRAILILNPDIIVREGSIDRLMEFLDAHPDAGIVGSKLVYPDGRLQHSCRSFYTMSALVLRRTFLGSAFPAGEAAQGSSASRLRSRDAADGRLDHRRLHARSARGPREGRRDGRALLSLLRGHRLVQSDEAPRMVGILRAFVRDDAHVRTLEREVGPPQAVSHPHAEPHALLREMEQVLLRRAAQPRGDQGFRSSPFPTSPRSI